jgi:Lanthionine-containing peptide SapB precursor RamS
MAILEMQGMEPSQGRRWGGGHGEDSGLSVLCGGDSGLSLLC